VSERTVSRYLPDRRTAPSQTWRTLLANHFGDLTCTSTVTSSYAQADGDVVDACGEPLRSSSSFRNGRCEFNQCTVIDWSLSHQRTSPGWRVAQHPLHQRRRTLSGRDPPRGVDRRDCLPRPTGASYLAFGDRIWPPRPMNGLRSFTRPAAGRHRAIRSPCAIRWRRRSAATSSLWRRSIRLSETLTAAGILARHKCSSSHRIA
jgi:hypothetical protein